MCVTAGRNTFLLREVFRPVYLMLQTELKVVAVGEPNIEALTDGKKRTFYESIFSRIVELHKQTQTENKNET